MTPGPETPFLTATAEGSVSPEEARFELGADRRPACPRERGEAPSGGNSLERGARVSLGLGSSKEP